MATRKTAPLVATCPRCGSKDAGDYAIVNESKCMTGLVFEKVLVHCNGCHSFYHVHVDGTSSEA